MKFIDYLVEEKNEIRHLEHLEDLLISKGLSAISDIKNLILPLYTPEIEGNVVYQLKIDGAPASVFGIDPRDKQFFISTKSAFSKEQTLCKSETDINNKFGGDLANKMILAFRYLSKLAYESNVAYQADFIFSSSDKKNETIDGMKYITFQPNVIKYAVGEGTDFYDDIANSKVGLVVHTKYKILINNDRLDFNQTSLDFSTLLTKTKPNGLFLIDNVITGEKQLAMQLKSGSYVKEIFKDIESRSRKLIDFAKLLKLNGADILLNTFINNEILLDSGNIHDDAIHRKEFKGEDYWTRFKKFITIKYLTRSTEFKTDKKKSATLATVDTLHKFLEKYKKEFIDFIRIFYRMVTLKSLVLSDLDSMSIFSKSYVGSEEGHEGFVIIDDNNIVKIVNRLAFSRMNKLTGKFRK